MSNIESFNRCTALILSDLYQAFPFRKEISLNSLPDGIFNDIPEDEYDGAFDRLVILGKTGKWLCDAGYIWAKEVTETKIVDAILSPKGLEVLKATPEAISTKETLGERMGTLVKEQSFKLLSKAVDAALSKGVAFVQATI